MKVRRTDIQWHSGLSIYASEPFLKVVGDEYGWLGGFDDANKLRCVLPYTMLRKPGFRMIRFRVETIPAAEDFDIAEEKAFLNLVVEHFRLIGADMIVPASNNTIFRTYPDGAIAAPYGSYIIDLTQPEETLWSGLHSKHRNVIRNAVKAGVQIATDVKHLETAHNLVRETLKRSGLGFMKLGALQRMVSDLGPYVKILIAEHQGVVQGCAVIPFSNHSAYYVYGGSIPNPATGAMNLLHWEAMRQFRELGVKRYDFVGVRINPVKGSKQEGLKMFKERFGGQLSQGFLWKCSIRPLKYWAYQVIVKVGRGGDIVDLEGHKLKRPSRSCYQQKRGAEIQQVVDVGRG